MEPTQPVVAPQPTTPPVVPPTVQALNYANFGRRWAAVFLDGLILGLVGFVINLPFTIVGTLLTNSAAPGDSASVMVGAVVSGIGSLINIIVGVGYYVYFIGKSGQTLGKKALGIKVIRLNGEPSVGYGNAFLRETVGKFVSSIILGIGFLMMLWDKDKQTLHDKMAGTVVVKL